MLKKINKCFITTSIATLFFVTMCNINIYADGLSEWCSNTNVLIDYVAPQIKEIEEDIKVVITAGGQTEQDKGENYQPQAELQSVKLTCDENGQNCNPKTSSIKIEVDAENPFPNFGSEKISMWDECVEELISKKQQEELSNCINTCNGDEDCLEDCNDNHSSNITESDLSQDEIQSCYDGKFTDKIENLDWGEEVNNEVSNCEAIVKYRDMEWTITFEGYKVKKAFDNDTFAFLLWDGEISNPNDTTHDPIFLVAKIDMLSAEFVKNYNSTLGNGQANIIGRDENSGSTIIDNSNTVITSTNAYEPKIYAPEGYRDKKIKDENQLFDYYIMVIDNPDSIYAHKYHIIEQDIYGDRLEKTTKEETQIEFSSEKTKNRGTNYLKRLRYSDITYKRFFEIKADWKLTLCQPIENNTNIYFQEYVDDNINILATNGSWKYAINSLNAISNQADAWSIGADVSVSNKTYSDGTTIIDKIQFPYDFNHISSNAIPGISPFYGNSYQMMLSFNDIYEKQEALLKDATTFGDTERGKIIIGVEAHDGVNTNYLNQGGNNQYYSLKTPFLSEMIFPQPDIATDLEGNEVTLSIGEWKWFEHQNGIINQVFYVEPEISTIKTPEKIRQRVMCIGQYHCDCEDINVLCSCEDEEAGCNDDDGSKDSDCPENGPIANGIGGCDESQQHCNEYGELVDSNGKMIIITNEKGYQVPSGGCGGVTGEGSTAYYEKYINSSTTLVE